MNHEASPVATAPFRRLKLIREFRARQRRNSFVSGTGICGSRPSAGPTYHVYEKFGLESYGRRGANKVLDIAVRMLAAHLANNVDKSN